MEPAATSGAIETLFVELVAKIDDIQGKVEKAMRAAEQSAARGERNIQKNFDGVGSASNRMAASVNGSVNSVSNSFAQIARASRMALLPIMALGTAVVGFGTKAVMMAASMESTRTGFTHLLGSAEAANKQIKELSEFAAKTPFEFVGLTNAARTFSAFGVEAEQLVPLMTNIGDAVSAVGGGQEAINRVTYALTQMLSTGRLNSQDMMQLANAGLQAWPALAEGIGVSIQEVRRMAEKGLIDGAQAATILVKTLGEKNAGLMEAQSKTLQGIFSNMKDNVDRTLIAIGNSIDKTFDVRGRASAVVDFLNIIVGALTEAEESGRGLEGLFDDLAPDWLKENILAIAGAIAGTLIPALATMAFGIAGVVLTLAPFAAAGAAVALIGQQIFGSWENLLEFFTELGHTLSDAAEYLLGVATGNEAMGKSLTYVDPKIREFVGFLGQIVQFTRDRLIPALGEIARALGPILQSAWTIGTKTLREVIKVLESVYTAIEETYKMAQNISKFIVKTFGDLQKAVEDLFKPLKDIKKGLDDLTQPLKDAADSTFSLGDESDKASPLITALAWALIFLTSAQIINGLGSLTTGLKSAATAVGVMGASIAAHPVVFSVAAGGVIGTSAYNLLTEEQKTKARDVALIGAGATPDFWNKNKAAAPAPGSNVDVQALAEADEAMSRAVGRKGFSIDAQAVAEADQEALDALTDSVKDLGDTVEKTKPKFAGFSGGEGSSLGKTEKGAKGAKSALDELGISIQKALDILEILGFTGDTAAAILESLGINSFDARQAFELLGIEAEKLASFLEKLGYTGQDLSDAMQKVADTLADRKAAIEAEKAARDVEQAQEAAAQAAEEHRSKLEGLANTIMGQLKPAFQTLINSLGGSGMKAAIANLDALADAIARVGPGGLGGRATGGAAGAGGTPGTPSDGEGGVGLPTPSGQDNGFYGALSKAVKTLGSSMSGIADITSHAGTAAADALATSFGSAIGLATSGGDVSKAIDLMKSAHADLGKFFGENLRGPLLSSAGAIQDYIKSLIDLAEQAGNDEQKLTKLGDAYDIVADKVKDLMNSAKEVEALKQAMRAVGSIFSDADMAAGTDALKRRFDHAAQYARDIADEARRVTETKMAQMFSRGTGGFGEGEQVTFNPTDPNTLDVRGDARIDPNTGLVTQATTSEERFKAWQVARFGKTYEQMQIEAYKQGWKEETERREGERRAIAQFERQNREDFIRLQLKALSSLGRVYEGFTLPSVGGVPHEGMVNDAVAFLAQQVNDLASRSDAYSQVMANLARAVLEGNIEVSMDGFAVGRMVNRGTIDRGFTAGQFGLR